MRLWVMDNQIIKELRSLLKIQMVGDTVKWIKLIKKENIYIEIQLNPMPMIPNFFRTLFHLSWSLKTFSRRTLMPGIHFLHFCSFLINSQALFTSEKRKIHVVQFLQNEYQNFDDFTCNLNDNLRVLRLYKEWLITSRQR